MSTNKKTHVVIVGGGFGGVRSALLLSNHPEMFDVTIISKLPYLIYYPTLFHTAIGQRSTMTSIKLTEIFKNKKVKIIDGEVSSFDRKSQTVLLADKSNYRYDKLILAMGEITNYFGIPGLDEYSYSVKSEKEVLTFNHHLHDFIIQNNQPDNNYFVVGAGPTGIELASRLPGYIHYLMKLHNVHRKAVHVELVEAREHLLPNFDRKFSRQISRRLAKLGVTIKLNSSVTALSENELTINGQGYQSKTVVWTAGVSTNPFYQNNNFAITKRGKVSVDVYLQAEDNVFVIGDNANTPYSGLAQTALNDGEFVAKNLIRLKRNKYLKPYQPKIPFSVIPVGKRWAATIYKNITIFGFISSILRQLGDLDGYLKLLPVSSALKFWLKSFKGEPNHCHRCQIKP